MNPKRPKDMPFARYRSLITENKASKGGQVYGLRQQGLTYEHIGRLIDPPVSKERVRQILARHERLLEAWGKLKEGEAY